jgi:hypothetical protein
VRLILFKKKQRKKLKLKLKLKCKYKVNKKGRRIVQYDNNLIKQK